MNLEEYRELIKQNEVVLNYCKKHNLTIDDLKQLLKDSSKFLAKLLTDKNLQERVMHEIYYHLKLEEVKEP